MGIIFVIFIFAGTSPVSNDLFITIRIDSRRAGFKVFKSWWLQRCLQRQFMCNLSLIFDYLNKPAVIHGCMRTYKYRIFTTFYGAYISSELWIWLINIPFAWSIFRSCKSDQSVLTLFSSSGRHIICWGAFFFGVRLPIKVNIGRWSDISIVNMPDTNSSGCLILTAHLAYSVHKSGRKTQIIIIVSSWHIYYQSV